MAIKDFEEVFSHIGGFGPYQWVIFGFVCLFNCFYTSTYFGQMFMVLTPPHWCQLPPSLQSAINDHFGPNMTQEQLKDLTIPLRSNGAYEQCKRYDIGLDQLASLSTYSGNPRNWSIINCDSGWEYNYSYYYPTITSELDWVCSDDWKPTLAQALFFVGCVVGVPVFGWLADHYGRIPIIVISNCIGGIFGVASSFSNSFVVFCILRFLVGVSFDSHYFVVYTLGLEFVSSPYRTIVANVPVMVFLSGTMAAIPWLALYLHNWTLFGVVIYAPMLIAVIVPFLMPESARWLIGRGETDKVIRIIERAGKVNGRELTPEFISDFKEYIFEERKLQPPKVVTWIDLLKTPNLRNRFFALCFLWLSISVVYDGFMRNSENIGYDFFVAFSILGVVELPADLLTIFLMEWIGRKNTVSITMIACGIISVITTALDPARVFIILGMAIAGRFLITMAMNVGMQYVMEVLPTVARAQGSAAIHAIGFLTTFVSPYIVYLSRVEFWIPYAVLGTMSVLGGISTLFLPETLNESLPDSLKDGENFFTDQSRIYNPFAKKNSKTTDGNGKDDLSSDLSVSGSAKFL